MIHCPACGKPNADEFRFCASCGGDLAAARTWAGATTTPRRHPADEDAAVRLPTVPPPPREPTHRTRGIIYAYTGKQAVMRLLGTIFTGIGLLVFAFIGHGLLLDIALYAAGRTEDAVVVDVHIDRNTSVNDVNPRTIRFTTASGERGESSTLDVGYASSLKPGDALRVDVIPGVTARVHGTMKSVLGWFGFFPLIFTLVGAPMLLSAVRSNRREIRAFRFGTAAVGRVTHIGLDTSTRMNGKNPTVLMWTFDVGGKSYEGSLSHMDGGVLRPLVAEDGRVPVVYDEKDPAANTIYVV